MDSNSEQEQFTAVDMATAAAQGFRDGQAAVEQATEQDEREAWRIMVSAHALCPHELTHLDKMRWMANYFVEQVGPAQKVNNVDTPEQKPAAFLYYDDSDVDADLKMKSFVLLVGSEGPEHHLARHRPGVQGVSPLYAAPQPEQSGKFAMHQRVRKTSGSEWQGRICGTYSTALTPEGYAVESEAHAGSVQIYPAKALEAVNV